MGTKFKYKKCDICGINWNVSNKKDLNLPFICPHCESKGLKLPVKPIVKSQRDGKVSKVLLKNKTKFERND